MFRDRVKGILLVILGAVWIFFVYNFNFLLGRQTVLEVRPIPGIFTGIIAVINGIRIYRRNNGK